MFDVEEIEEPDQEGATAVTYNQLIMPGNKFRQRSSSFISSIMPHIEVVISLNGTDDFLKQRVINLPESVVSGTHNNEEGNNLNHQVYNDLQYIVPGFMRRLTTFREQNEEDDTVLNYFDELEIHPNPIGTYICVLGPDNTSKIPQDRH